MLRLKILFYASALASLCIGAFYSLLRIEPLDAPAHNALKEGKSFWSWSSPYGELSSHYTETGSGSNHILLIHGFRAHTFTWRHLIAPLTQSGFHVWTLDLIGFGLSDKPIHTPYSVDFFQEHLIAFMQAKKIASAHLVGNSLGGGLALKLAVEAPDLVKSLTLISPLGYPLHLPFYITLFKHVPSFWEPFLSHTMIRHGLKEIIYKSENISESQVEAYSLPYRLLGGLHASLETLKSYDNVRLYELCQYYPYITQPMLIIWGEQDKLTPARHLDLFKKDVPTAQTLLIPTCGHIAQEEEPTLVLRTIQQFLKSSHFPLETE